MYIKEKNPYKRKRCICGDIYSTTGMKECYMGYRVYKPGREWRKK
jgi:hypothetical protein